MDPKDQIDPLVATSSSTALRTVYAEVPVLCSFTPLNPTQETEEFGSFGVFSTRLNALRWMPPHTPRVIPGVKSERGSSLVV